MDELLTVQDVAVMLSITEQQVRQYIRSGNLKAHKLGNHLWRVWQKDLEAFINNGKVNI